MSKTKAGYYIRSHTTDCETIDVKFSSVPLTSYHLAKIISELSDIIKIDINMGHSSNLDKAELVEKNEAGYDISCTQIYP